MDLEDKKSYSDKWFSYLQTQICNQFEKIEKKAQSQKKFISTMIGIKKIMVKVEEHLKFSKMEKYLIKWV